MTSESDRARAWRKQMGLSQTELALLTGFSLRSVQIFETGNREGRPIDRSFKLATGPAASRPDPLLHD